MDFFRKALFLLAVFSFSPASVCLAALIESYPAPEQMYAEIRAIADADPERVELIEYGRSVQGRPLLALRFHLGDGASRPGGMVAGNIHGEEWIGNRTAMAVAGRIAAGLDSDPFIRDLLSKMDLYVLPCLNPDGYYRTWDSKGRDKLGQMRKNDNGVDLNRNFPAPGGKEAGKAEKPDSVNYPGPEPLSEPETKAVVEFVLEREIIATVDYHSVRGEVITPACHHRECYARYRTMCKAYFKGQERVKYLALVTPGPFETPGMMEPHLYYEYGVMAILIELGFSPVNVLQNRSVKVFEIFNPRDSRRWAENEVEATLRALEAAFAETGGERVPRENR